MDDGIPSWKRSCSKCGRKSFIVRQNRDRKHLFWRCSGFPKRCSHSERFSSFDYVMLSVDKNWYPDFINRSRADLLFRRCQSKQEIVYILGTLFFLAKEISPNWVPPDVIDVSFGQERLPCIYIQDAWPPWSERGLFSPGCLLVVPQMPFATKYHHDFGLLYQGDHSPKEGQWRIKCGVEIDIHASHYMTTIDQYRDSLVKYPVFRLSKDDNPKTWIDKLFRYEAFLQKNIE